MASNAAASASGRNTRPAERPALAWAVLLGSGLLYGLTVWATPIRSDEHDVLVAAMSLARDGALPFLSGSHDLGALLSVLASSLLELGGDPPIAMVRLPSILATAVAAAWLFVWLREHAGTTVAGIATILFVPSGWALQGAHSAGQGALLTLLVLVSATWLFDASRSSAGATRRRIAAAALLLIAFQLQPSAAIAALGLLIWCLPGMLRALVDQHFARRTPILIVAAAVFLPLLALIAPAVIGTVTGSLLSATAESEVSGDNLFYLHDLWVQAPLLTLFLPVAAVFAWRRSPPLAAHALVLLIVPLLVHSVTGSKAAGACAYVIPYLAIIYALALAGPAKQLRAHLSATLARQGADRKVAQVLSTALLLLLGAAAIVLANPAYRHTVQVVQMSAGSMTWARQPAVTRVGAIWSDHAASGVFGAHPPLSLPVDLKEVAV
ncbi:hypothetical protein [Sphingomonas sp. IC4-52]|uniref:hypothetical protein n=1 Tax=Sphingomonas sp. IC4-52 TaxID=2887202 RepID=UPI001D128691|nr:hypothetical protein [Sphingomonas sp. IC4-52]MCC2981324.1 hypothetical protein [Sphingomonas sp. IC4-52]